ncbi:MAG: hypothetical protein ACI4WR_00050, partial [Bulleidia sp.]
MELLLLLMHEKILIGSAAFVQELCYPLKIRKDDLLKISRFLIMWRMRRESIFWKLYSSFPANILSRNKRSGRSCYGREDCADGRKTGTRRI